MQHNETKHNPSHAHTLPLLLVYSHFSMNDHSHKHLYLEAWRAGVHSLQP